MLERRSPDTTLEQMLYRHERPAMHTETADWVEQPYIEGEQEVVADEPTQEDSTVSPDDGGEAGSGETSTP